MNEIVHPETKELTQCGNPIFVDAYRLKYVSPIISPTGQQTIGNLLIGKMCVACLRVFNPDEWLKAKQERDKILEGTVLEKKKGG